MLGDRFGTSCDPAVVDLVEEQILAMGFSVARNDPYAGGFVTQNYGRPTEGLHALQIEVNRSLYMDEQAIARLPKMAGLVDGLARLIDGLRTIDAAALQPPPQTYADAAQ